MREPPFLRNATTFVAGRALRVSTFVKRTLMPSMAEELTTDLITPRSRESGLRI